MSLQNSRMAITKKPYIAMSPIHRARYAKKTALGMSVEEISKEERVSIETVARSIRDVEVHNSMFGVESLEQSGIEVILAQKELEKNVLAEALTAEKIIYSEAEDTLGEILATEPDHDVRLRAFDAVTKRTAAVLSRHSKGGVTVNTNVGVGVVDAANGLSYEERLREVLRRRDPVSDGLPAGDVIDVAT
jgi:hypothetical protein